MSGGGCGRDILHWVIKGGGAIANTISNGEASYVNKTLDGCMYPVKS
jgi:hypothetical protein